MDAHGGGGACFKWRMNKGRRPGDILQYWIGIGGEWCILLPRKNQQWCKIIFYMLSVGGWVDNGDCDEIVFKYVRYFINIIMVIKMIIQILTKVELMYLIVNTGV